jgi:ABC-type polysaccharide/polyol phosphate export permease
MRLLESFRNATNDIYDSSKRPHPMVEEIFAAYKYRELIYQFVSRSVKTRYKRSALGVIWTMLNPLLTMVVLTIVFSSLFRFQIEHFPIYILSGQVVWIFFSSVTNGAMGEMVWSGDLLKRIYVPKSVFVLSAIGTGLVNIGLSLVPLLAISLIVGVRLTPALFIWPLSILLLSIFSMGVGFLLSTTAVYFADMLPVYDVILTIWLYATPIIYPLEIVPENWLWLFRLNPLYYLVEVFRIPLLYGILPNRAVWIPAIITSLLVVLIGGWIFSSRARDYAYHI